MSFIGSKPSQTLATPTSQYFNGTGSQTVFTLNRAVNVAEDLEVFVNNIQQEPGVGKSYTAVGTALTFDAAPSSGTANVYVVYRGLAEVTTRLEHDPNAALAATTGTFSGAFTSPGIDDNATSTAMTLDANSNVGINTTSLNYGKFTVQNTAGTGKVLLDSYQSVPTTENVMAIYADASNGYIESYNNGYKNIIIAGSGGNVKIGEENTDVTSRLTVSGKGSADTATFMYDGNTGTFLDINTNAANGVVSLEANARSGNFPPLTFITGGSERLRIDSSGNVGIGSVPSYKLHVEGVGNQFIFLNNASTNDGLYLKAGAGASSLQTNGGSHTMNFYTSGTERLRIDSSGRVTMPYQPSFYAQGTAAYQAQSGGFAYSTTSFNIGGHYNTSTYRFTAPVAGLYYFSAAAIMQASAADGGLVLVVNGTFNFAKDYTNGAARSSNVSSVIYLNANDYVFVNNEGNNTWYLTDGYGFFSGCLIG